MRVQREREGGRSTDGRVRPDRGLNGRLGTCPMGSDPHSLENGGTLPRPRPAGTLPGGAVPPQAPAALSRRVQTGAEDGHCPCGEEGGTCGGRAAEGQVETWSAGRAGGQAAPVGTLSVTREPGREAQSPGLCPSGLRDGTRVDGEEKQGGGQGQGQGQGVGAGTGMAGGPQWQLQAPQGSGKAHLQRPRGSWAEWEQDGLSDPSGVNPMAFCFIDKPGHSGRFRPFLGALTPRESVEQGLN